MSRTRSEIQFIHSSKPGLPGVASTEMRRLVHSHAARAAHARTRRQRLIEYHAIKTTSGSEDESLPFSTVAAEIGISVIPSPSPLGFLGSHQRDPFASFARSLNPIEDFLLDYCKWGSLTSEEVDICRKSATSHGPPKKQIFGD